VLPLSAKVKTTLVCGAYEFSAQQTSSNSQVLTQSFFSIAEKRVQESTPFGGVRVAINYGT